MLVQHTLDRLRQMGLHGMAQALETQRTQPDVHGLTFEDRLGLLVDQEWTLRQNRRLTRLLQEAKLRFPTACLEDVDYHRPRGLDRSLLRSLGTGEWIRAQQVVLISGPTGIGKSWIACALGNAACRQGFSTRYYRVPRLLTDLALAHADGSYPRLAKTHLLVLDDWGLAPLSASDARELLEVIEDRVQVHATLITSQLPLDALHSAIADPTLADAILDRLVHHAHKLVLKGESMRKVLAGGKSKS
ncbi:MAG: AAA family ATPase [Chloroflexota bacterium]